jgi:hypothetical protein
MMYKHILTVLRGDEAITFLVAEPLYCSLHHLSLPPFLEKFIVNPVRNLCLYLRLLDFLNSNGANSVSTSNPTCLIGVQSSKDAHAYPIKRGAAFCYTQSYLMDWCAAFCYTRTYLIVRCAASCGNKKPQG